MTPKEKASELVERFTLYSGGLTIEENHETSKQCALIAVEEIMEVIPKQDEFGIVSEYYQFMQQVKTEIENL